MADGPTAAGRSYVTVTEKDGDDRYIDNVAVVNAESPTGFADRQFVVTARQQADGDIETDRASSSDTANSSTTPLGPDETFVGAWVDTTGFSGGMVLTESDVASAANGVLIEFSEDESTVHRTLTLTYNDEAVGNGLPRFYPTMQGEYVRIQYTNGPVPQADFVLRHELLSEAAQLPLSSLDADVNGTSLSSMVRAGVMAPDDNGDWSTVSRATEGLRVAVHEHEVDTPIKAKQVWDVRGTNVSSNGSVQLALPAVTGMGTISLQNEGAGTVFIARSVTDIELSNRRRRLYSASSVELDITEDSEVWAIALDTGGATSSVQLDGDTATGGTNPTDALTTNDTRASIAAAETLEVSGYEAQRLLDEVSRVVIGFEGRIAASSPSTETVAFVDDVDVTAGNVGSITSPTVTSDADHLYIASITRRNGSASVTTVTGLGLTWTAVTDITDDSGSNRISVWCGTGTPTGDGTVQAVFSATATNCTMKVTRWSGVDLADPVDNFETKDAAGSSSSYTDAIDGTDEGMAVTFVTSARRTHTPGSGFTELTKLSTGNGPNDSRQSVARLALGATGSQAYSGTFSSGADWVLVALTLTPRPLDDPQVTLSYEVSGSPGPTSEVVTVDSASDTDYTLDITADRAWTFDDVDNLSVLIDGASLTSGIVEVDHAYVTEEEAEDGVTQFVTATVVGDSI